MTAMTAEFQIQPYANPPIIEAVFEVRFAEPISEAKVTKAKDWLTNQYANSATEVQAEVKVDFATRSAKFIDVGKKFRLTSTDQTNLCLLAPASAIWVRLAPYEGWESFAARIASELPTTLKAFGNPPLARLGLRYVNRIDVKLIDGIARHEDYLNFRIVHGELLEPTNGFQWRLVKEFNELNLKANVQSGVVETEVPGFAAFSFDIDIFCDSILPKNANEIIEKIEYMRQLKNKIFEAGITEKARKAYS